MAHRWHPPGKGWITTWDYGRLAVWMRPEPEGGVSIALYASEYFNENTEVWIMRVPRGSWLPYEVMDKPHRIRWGVNSQWPHVAGELLLHKQIPPSHSGHRRTRRNTRIYRRRLPRKLRQALDPGMTVAIRMVGAS